MGRDVVEDNDRRGGRGGFVGYREGMHERGRVLMEM